MFIIAEFFRALTVLTGGIFTILTWLIIARIVISWLPVDPYHSVVQFLVQVTEPILAPFRRIPLRIGMLDLSPLLAFFALSFVGNVLVGIFSRLANHFSSGGF